jgi:hypothetical protein
MTLHVYAFESDPDPQSIVLRLHPLDVGFDLRGRMAVELLDTAPEVRVSFAAKNGDRLVAKGPISMVAAVLTAAGYQVVTDPRWSGYVLDGDSQ